MAEAADHVLVQQFFDGRGLVAERIPEIKTKTPDFRILRGTEVVAYCEVKSPQDVFAERLPMLYERGGEASSKPAMAMITAKRGALPERHKKRRHNSRPLTRHIW